MKKKILIVGGTGFIGYHLAKICLKKNFLLLVYLVKSKKWKIFEKVKYIKCDISNQNNLKKNIKENFDYVVNLGGYVNHNEKVKTFNSHYKGCKNLADFLKKKNYFFYSDW